MRRYFFLEEVCIREEPEAIRYIVGCRFCDKAFPFPLVKYVQSPDGPLFGPRRTAARAVFGLLKEQFQWRGKLRGTDQRRRRNERT